MTRHPKKKEHEKKSDPSKSTANDVPTSEPSNQTEAIKIKNPLDKLFWIRVGLGVLAGIISAQIGNSTEMELRPYVGFGIMILLFIISYGIAKAMRIPLPPADKKKLIMTGIGSYFFMFIFSWILVNTLMHPAVIDLSPVR
ncbi:MAG: hypothetical protein ACREAF_01770 [Nitrosopumilaceae archaeon]